MQEKAVTAKDWMDEVIDQARRRGEFDGLPGAGKPLSLPDDDPYAGPDAEAYRLLKNAGFKPEWVELRGKIVSEINWLRANPAHPQRTDRIAEVNLLIAQHNEKVPNPTLTLPKLPISFPG